MKGAPIEGAMAAARAFLAERKEDLPVAIIVFGPDDTVLTDFTTNTAELAAAVAKAPATAEGTHIYDALIERRDMAKDAGTRADDGRPPLRRHRRRREATRAEALAALDEANVRVISVGLKSPAVRPGDAQERSRSGRAARTSRAATPPQLEPIFEEIGQQLSSEYEVTYRSLLPPQREGRRRS